MTDTITQAVFLKMRIRALSAIKEYHDTSDAYIYALEDHVTELEAERDGLKVVVEQFVNAVEDSGNEDSRWFAEGYKAAQALAERNER